MSTSIYHKSVLFVLLGALCLSFLGIADRNMTANGPQIAMVRSIGQMAFFGILFFGSKTKPVKAELKSLSGRGWLAIFLMALSGFFLIMALQYTYVANAVFIISLTPLIAASLAWIFLKERISRSTAIAMIIAIIGVGLIFGTNLNPAGITGMAFAIFMTIAYASVIVLMRVLPDANVILMSALSGFLTFVLMLPLIGDFDITTKDWIICLSLGVFQVGLGTVLVMSGAKHVPSAQVSILALLEVVLSPIWVWVFANEIPPLLTLLGGSVVLLGVIYQALNGTENSRTETTKV